MLLRSAYSYLCYIPDFGRVRSIYPNAAAPHKPPFDMTEFGLIDTIRDMFAAIPRNGFDGIGDDCTVFPLGSGESLVFTADLLAEKAENPHLLVMSATPIPRTLGLLIYGDLDISILDELPPGRKPVKTRCITGKKRRDLYGFLDREIGAGRQVYIVCPAIEDTPDGGLNAVKSYYEDIAKALLPDRRVGLMHGKLKPKEKAAVMDDFKAGQLDALVSTTVIEVGVDVPNATVMVIENAERYGLSALHQLRGRVGRGAAESWCFLVSDNTAESVQKRLKFLCSTLDGFAVAQFDLETRGPGDFFGSRQHGLPTLQIADLMNDTRTLHAAQAEAAALLAADPLLEAPEHSLLAAQVEQMFTKAGAMN